MSDDPNSEPPPYQPHDTAFKWLIGKYPNDFFALFFKNKKAKHIQNLDKKFIQKLEQHKAPVEADLVMAMQIEIEDHAKEVAVVLELKSKKADIEEQLYTYCFHALAMFGKTVWPIVLFTDDQDWQVPTEVEIPAFYSVGRGITYLVIDLIKISRYQAEKLSKHPTMLAKLIALKADDRNTTREQLVKAIIDALSDLDQDDPELLMLVKRFLNQYSKLSPTRLKQVKEAAGMLQVASTITEHYIMEGERKGIMEGERRGKLKGIIEGERRGELRGIIKGKIENLQEFYAEGMIPEPLFRERLKLLKQQLLDLQAQSHLQD